MDPESKVKQAKLPNGTWAVVAEYKDHKLPEYNNNPMIQALPPILSQAEFVDRVTRLPKFIPEERELEPHYRFHCIERLSRYFDPQNNSLQLQQLVCVLLMEGYLGRNPLEPEYARRSNQIYSAVKAGDGKNLEDHVNLPTSASSLTLIGPSGMGKTTNLINILELYPQVIVHPEHNVYQLVWLKVDCPHAGSLKGLCIDIFLAVDKLLGTNYFKKFGSRGNSEDYMLAQVAQLAHTQHLGVLVIDEMQNLATARRGRDELLNFLVKMDNTIGVPVIRVGTNEAFPIFQGNFRNARRATGKEGILWDRMQQFEIRNGIAEEEGRDWSYFIEGIWEYQWTKSFTTLCKEIKDVFYDECQGIIDIAIKLYKMVQWRAISLGGEEIITVDLIRQVAKEGLYLVKPMLDYIRDPKKDDWAIKYKDIAPLDTMEYHGKCLSELKAKEIEEVRQLARTKQRDSKQSAILRQVICELLNLDVEPQVAKGCAEKVVERSSETSNIQALVKEAYSLALAGEPVKEEDKLTGSKRKSASSSKTKGKSKYQETDIRWIVENAKKNQTSAYEALRDAGVIGDDLLVGYLDLK